MNADDVVVCDDCGMPMSAHTQTADGYTCPERPPDELGARRAAKSDEAIAANAGVGMMGALDQAYSLLGMKRAQEFQQWMLDNMPTTELGQQANGMAGGIVGSVIGAWFDAGASPDLVKEYLTRFVDLSWVNYKATMDALNSMQGKPGWVCQGCGFPNTVSLDEPCEKCGKDGPDA